LWTAKDCCDGYLKRLLLRLIEWHAQASHMEGYDTWHKGRFLEEWADPRVVTELESVFAHYESADIWRALVATLRLFRWLAQETTARWGYLYPTLADECATSLVAILQTEQVS
jgi:aminoglycoside 6-adenylyltransferase